MKYSLIERTPKYILIERTPSTESTHFVSFYVVDCEKDVNKMLDESSSEHLQPMKDKMEHFICHVKDSLHTVSTKLSSVQELFNKASSYHTYNAIFW